MEHELEAAHIKVVRFRPGFHLPSSPGKGLIVITGHSSPEMARFVEALGASGAFDGKYVLFNSCETALSRQLIMEINTRYGAISTFAHEGAIKVDDLDPFLRGVASDLSSGEQKTFHQVVLDALHREGLNGIWTICSLPFWKLGLDLTA